MNGGKRTMVIIPKKELEFSYSRSGGPGGQNVNRRETKVTVRWNFFISPILTEEQKCLVARRLKNRLTEKGALAVSCQTERTQEGNKKIALRLLSLIVTAALVIPAPRKPTRPTRSSKEKRLREKKLRSEKKKLRKLP